MKRRITILILCLLLVPALLYADYARTSYEQTTSQAVSKIGCVLTGILVITNGTNAATVILYDNASAASGSVLAEFVVAGADRYGGRDWCNPVHCINGIYAAVSGIGASYIVEYTSK